MTVDVLSTPPSSFAVFSRALLSMAKRGRKPVLPDISLVLERATTDRDKLRAYNEVCGFETGKYMPALWPHILAFPLRMTLMGDARFPFPLPGLVHISNETRLYRPIAVDETLRLQSSFGPAYAHDKGITFATITEAKVGGELVWRDESINLFRTRDNKGLKPAARDDEDQAVDEPSSTQVWNLSEDLGRRYGRASGDLNPIHLHPLSARAFGYPRAIAHGMFSAAHGLATLPEYSPAEPLTYKVWFKLPLFLPGQVTNRQKTLSDGARFEVRDKKGEKPHARGRLFKGIVG